MKTGSVRTSRGVGPLRFFIYKLVPETKGKTLEEIEEAWKPKQPQHA